MEIAYKIAILKAMTKLFALALIASLGIATAAVFAQEPSAHLLPAGTTVRDKVTLVGKSVPLPPGDFVMVASRTRDATRVKGEWIRQRVQLVTVYLAQVEGNVLRAEVLATTVLDPSFTYSKWEDEPCRRTDTLFRQDLAGNPGYQQNCLLVNHVPNVYTREPEGIYAEAYTWLQKHAVNLPVGVIIQATITRIEVGEWLATVHRFNPAAFGCDVGRNPSWAASAWHPNALAGDAERAQFVKSVVEWGKFVQAQVDDEIRNRGARSRDAAPPSPQLHRCRPKAG